MGLQGLFGELSERAEYLKIGGATFPKRPLEKVKGAGLSCLFDKTTQALTGVLMDCFID